MVAAAAPDTPVSPDGNGQDTASPDLMAEIAKLEREQKAGRKRGARASNLNIDALPNKAKPAPPPPPVAEDDPDESILRSMQASSPEVLAKVLQQTVNFEARRPEADEFFRTHPTQKSTLWLLERKFNVRGADEERFYQVDEHMVPKLIGCKSKVARFEIRRAISNQGIEFLIPVPLDTTLGHAKGMRAYVEKAETTWIKVVSQKSKVVFEEGVNQELVPEYSTASLARMIVSAFGEGRIQSEDHPIYKAVRGE
jgi:hypothetical protein